jgi:hypothetical protein
MTDGALSERLSTRRTPPPADATITASAVEPPNNPATPVKPIRRPVRFIMIFSPFRPEKRCQESECRLLVTASSNATLGARRKRVKTHIARR